MSDAIKRLREYATGKRERGYVFGQITVAELLALLNIAEAAQEALMMVEEYSCRAQAAHVANEADAVASRLRAALAKLEAP